MNRRTSSLVAQRIQQKLEEITSCALEEFGGSYDFNLKIRNRIDEQMTQFVRSSTIVAALPFRHKNDIKNISYKSNCYANIISGQICIDYCEHQDIRKYGGPGYPGNTDGQICIYPKHFGKQYVWNDFSCKWKLVTPDELSCRNGSNSNKLMNNAAFGSVYGGRKGGEDIFGNSGRKANGQKMWGTIPFRQPMATFSKIDFQQFFKAIYDFSINISAAVGLIDEIEKTSGLDKKKIKVVKEKEDNLEESSDTIHIILNAKIFDSSGKHINGWRKSYNDEKKVKKDSAFFTNKPIQGRRIEINLDR